MLHAKSSGAGRWAVLGTLALLVALNLLNYTDRYILPGELSLLQREFHASDKQMGLLTTALFACYMLAAPATGWLGDRLPRKPLIVTGAALWSLAALSAVWVHDYHSFFFRYGVVGIGEATFGVFAPAVIADFFDERERNFFLSIFYVAIPVGAALGFVAGGVMGPLWGWRRPFLICAVPGLLVATLYAVFGQEPVRGASDRVRPDRNRTSFRGLFRNGAFLTATLGLAALTFAMGGISAWVAEFLRRETGMTVAHAGELVGAITVVDGLLGTVVGGWLAQRWLRRDDRALYLLSFWSVALTIPFGALTFFGPPRLAVVFLFFAEFFLFLNTGPLNAALSNAVGAEVRATAISVNLFCIHFFGDTFSPSIIGAVSDRTNLRLGLGVTLISLFVSAAILGLGARFAPKLAPAAEEPGSAAAN